MVFWQWWNPEGGCFDIVLFMSKKGLLVERSYTVHFITKLLLVLKLRRWVGRGKKLELQVRRNKEKKPRSEHGGRLLVSALVYRVFQVRALAGDIVLCCWARHLTVTVPLSTQVCKWVPASLMLGVTLRWTSIPSRGCRNTPGCLMLGVTLRWTSIPSRGELAASCDRNRG